MNVSKINAINNYKNIEVYKIKPKTNKNVMRNSKTIWKACVAKCYKL